MGNYISKINKDHFFVYKKFMKNDISFSKGKTRRALEIGARGMDMYGSIFHNKVLRNNDVDPVTN